MNNTRPNKIIKAVPFDIVTINKCSDYAEKHGLSFSAAVRLAVNEFFLNLGDD